MFQQYIGNYILIAIKPSLKMAKTLKNISVLTEKSQRQFLHFLKTYFFLPVSLCLGETGSVLSVRGSSSHSFLRWTIQVFDIPSLSHQNQWSQKYVNFAELFLAQNCPHVGSSICVEVSDPNHSLNNSSSISVYCSNICWIKCC